MSGGTFCDANPPQKVQRKRLMNELTDTLKSGLTDRLRMDVFWEYSMYFWITRRGPKVLGVLSDYAAYLERG